ncbi:hypothetical protein PMIN06_011217 [Paraphaeosphaeria minitans]
MERLRMCDETLLYRTVGKAIFRSALQKAVGCMLRGYTKLRNTDETWKAQVFLFDLQCKGGDLISMPSRDPFGENDVLADVVRDIGTCPFAALSVWRGKED